MSLIGFNSTKLRSKLLAGLVLFFFVLNTATAFALPTDPKVINGQATFATSGNTLNITNSPNAIINWNSFSIGSNELTKFIQQSSTSAVLNRVTGGNASAIYGALQSNGRIFLINQNGILFGPGASVDVNKLVASTLDIKNEDFLAGRFNFFKGTAAGSIEN
ncbi:MAG: filamentous hemagglutinin N-terminal domain-containing protein, partial [Deltaproteobacteria bacterium]